MGTIRDNAHDYMRNKYDGNYDSINKPKHYNVDPSGVEPIQITEHMNFLLGNVIKYVMRHKHKNGIEDLKKAAWYLDREIKRQTNEALQEIADIEQKQEDKSIVDMLCAPSPWVDMGDGYETG